MRLRAARSRILDSLLRTRAALLRRSALNSPETLKWCQWCQLFLNCGSYPSLRVEPSMTLRESRVVSVNTRLDGDLSILDLVVSDQLNWSRTRGFSRRLRPLGGPNQVILIGSQTWRVDLLTAPWAGLSVYENGGCMWVPQDTHTVQLVTENVQQRREWVQQRIRCSLPQGTVKIERTTSLFLFCSPLISLGP